MVKQVYGIFQKYAVRGEEDKTENEEKLLWCVTSKKKADWEVERLYKKYPDQEDSYLIHKYFYKPIPLY